VDTSRVIPGLFAVKKQKREVKNSKQGACDEDMAQGYNEWKKSILV
jgi:hypothetical protein